MTRDINQWPYDGEDGMSQNLLKGMGDLWTETNEQDFWHQLEVLPPIRQDSDMFMVGECYTHRESDGASMYAVFVKIDDRYFGKIGALKEFKNNSYLQEIKNQFGI